MVNNIEELRKDLAELKQFHDVAVRPKIKDWLSVQIRKIETEISALVDSSSAAQTAAAPKSSSAAPSTPYTVQLTTYGFDQSEKFVKLYLTSLSGVQNIPVGNTESKFTDRSVWVMIRDLDGKNYEMHINKLAHPIEPSSSLVKIKTDCVLIMLKKKEVGKNWDCVTLQEQILKEKNKPKYKPDAGADPSGDPSAGLMTMMKQMYDEGDDDMKRTIAKAWTEAREKKTPGMDMDM